MTREPRAQEHEELLDACIERAQAHRLAPGEAIHLLVVRPVSLDPIPNIEALIEDCLREASAASLLNVRSVEPLGVLGPGRVAAAVGGRKAAGSGKIVTRWLEGELRRRLGGVSVHLNAGSIVVWPVDD